VAPPHQPGRILTCLCPGRQTITDYLFEVRAIAWLMKPLGPAALLYLAAAVSDFFVQVFPFLWLVPYLPLGYLRIPRSRRL
jgi:hypothetical protein